MLHYLFAFTVCILVFTIGLFACFGLGLFLVVKVQAAELTPLDLLSGNENFEVRVGIDKNLGRYYSYHYEF